MKTGPYGPIFVPLRYGMYQINQEPKLEAVILAGFGFPVPLLLRCCVIDHLVDLFMRLSFDLLGCERPIEVYGRQPLQFG